MKFRKTIEVQQLLFQVEGSVDWHRHTVDDIDLHHIETDEPLIDVFDKGITKEEIESETIKELENVRYQDY